MIPINEQPYPLPNGWQWCRLGEVTKNQYGYTAKALKYDSLPKMLRITDIQDGAVNWHEVPNCEIDDEQKKKYLLQDNDIVIARTGATTGKSYIVRNPINSVFASYLIRLQLSKPINVRYLYHFLQSDLYWQQISELSAGIAQPGVNSSKLKRMLFPLPPLDEQQRIVSLLDKLFADLDAAKALAQAVVDGSKLRRAAILHKAFTGELTKLWRDEHGTTIDNWQKNFLSDALISSKQKTNNFASSDLKYVGLENMEKNGERISFQAADEVRSTKNIFRVGDLLYGKLRPYLNKHGVAKFDGVCSTDILVFKASGRAKIEFINYFLSLPKFIEYAVANSKGINLPRVSEKIILCAEIFLPPLDEQKEIVRLLNDLLGREQRTKKLCRKILDSVEITKKSILVRAFRGELD